MNRWQLDCKDVLEWCAEYDGPKFHAMICDPPYHLTSITKRFGKKDAAPAQYGRDGAFQRVSKGFMGSTWDGETGGVGIAFDPATWAALSEHLLPGAFIFVFGSSRGWHRLAVAIEDAGFIFHPSLMVWGWVNGAGFPKATRIDTQIDKAAGKLEEREVVGRYVHPGTGRELTLDNMKGSTNPNPMDWGKEDSDRYQIEKPATDLARVWEGHRYGRQALKPAVEMIICAQKPYSGKPVDCIVETGAGALFIDGGRIGTKGGTKKGSFPNQESVSCYGDGLNGPCEVTDIGKGRWPPNFCLVHSPDCRRAGTKQVKGSNCKPEHVGQGREGNFTRGIYGAKESKVATSHTDADGLETVPAWECVEECAARRLGEQSGERQVSGTAKLGKPIQRPGGKYTCYGKYAPSSGMAPNDKGTAACFFPQFSWAAEVAERLANSDQVMYCAKASRNERDAGCDELPLQERTTQGRDVVREIDRKDGKGTVPVNAQIRPARNPHPTVKPISLATWLSKLLLPPPEYAPRRILVPFAGVASEMIATSLAGWEFVHGIEMSEEYCEIGEARLSWWLRQLRLPGIE